MPSFVLGRPIGLRHAPFVIAALDCGKIATPEEVCEAIDEAAETHCDAVKLAALPVTWCARVFEHADQRGIPVIATVTDERTVEVLDWFGVSAFEIFFDWSDLDLVACAARTGKPLLLSFANASEAELAEVVALARAEGARGLALVQRVADAGLVTLEALGRLGTIYGISDRSASPELVSSAIELGARILERRLAPRRIKAELAELVRECDRTWASLGIRASRWTSN
jgi:sialic acid synthase SpsE